jgi:hypothetical protein
MRKAQPLYIRLYQEPHLSALVRLIGYEGVPVAEAKQQLKALSEEFGVEKMKAAVQELVHIDGSQEPAVARLKESARKVAWQLLGPPVGS